MTGEMLNRGKINDAPILRYEDMNEFEKAKADLDYYRHKGGNAYKQAKRHYEKLLRKGRYAAR